MASYKVIQDVEAEDKILGPLTLRQFIYAGGAAIFLYLCYFVYTHGAPFLVAILLPAALILGFFAFPWGRDQPTEIWALAKIRFQLKPRRRIWDQSGAKELVTVTAPKKEQENYGNGLSQVEVKSRLKALADTIDSRGWVLKNANVSMFGQPSPLMGQAPSDRLLSLEDFPQPLAASDVQASDDMLDERNNRIAHNMESMIEAKAKEHRSQLIESLRGEPNTPTAAPPANNYWFLNQPSQSAKIPSDMVTFNTQVVSPGMEEEGAPALPGATTNDEQKLIRELETHKQQLPGASYYGHLHMVQPLSAQHAAPTPTLTPPAQAAQPVAGVPQIPAAPPPGAQPPTAAPVAPAPQVTPAQQAAILQLANNNDLNVATIAREAERSGGQDEVVIKLH